MFVSMKVSKAVLALIVFFLLVGAVFGILQAAVPASAKADREGVSVPIVMYHSLLKDPSKQGEFVVSPDLFESDLKYLKDRGYTTIVVQDLIDYVYNDKPLPQKPVMLTFDDGNYNNYYYAFPLLKKYDCKMVLSPIGKIVEKYSGLNDTHVEYAYITWDQINEMMASGYVEMQNHSYNLHDSGTRLGSQRVNGESEEHYRQVFMGDISTMQSLFEQHTGYRPAAFVYPYGVVSSSALPMLKEMGFKCTMICSSKGNRVTRNPDCLYGLNRYKRPPYISSAQFFANKL